MLKLSANLGFLWQELSLIDAIYTAKRAGFHAVECHWPYDYPAHEVQQALTQTGLPMLSLNTQPGNRKQHEFGLCALPDKQTEARQSIQEAIQYAAALGAGFVHIMPGVVEDSPTTREVFVKNLTIAAILAKKQNVQLLLEPINREDVPNYFLGDLPSALEIKQTLAQQGHDNIKILFDCYHIAKIHGELEPLLEKHLSDIGHIQFAAVPTRSEPDRGSVNYYELLPWLHELGYQGYAGAEYQPKTSTNAGLSWMNGLV